MGSPELFAITFTIEYETIGQSFFISVVNLLFI
jgi:hypothetical protein